MAVLCVSLLGLAGCNLPKGFHDYVVFEGLTQPTAVEFSPDGRVFVAEKRGVVKVYDGVDDRTATVVADLRTNVYNSWDRGLLGLALAPDFPADPNVYVAYTYDALPGGTAPHWGEPGTDVDVCPTPPGATADGCVVTSRVSRLEVHDGVWDGDEHVLVEDWCQQYPSHTVGTLAFGADGGLYAGAGDGASFNWADHGQRGNPCGDPALEGGALRSQDLETDGDPVGLGGTIIRIDPATGDALPTNPRAQADDPNEQRIVAYGLRNPFRFTVRPGTDELWIGDVGWRTWEEINRTVGNDDQVDNFGWPCFEGDGPVPEYAALDLPICEGLYAEGTTTDPMYTYRAGRAIDDERCRTDRGSSITGVAFTPAESAYPEEYDGALFFADAARRCIFVMHAGDDGHPDPSQVTYFHQGAVNPVEIEFGPGGELWYVDLYGGTIRRIGYSDTNAPPQAVLSASPQSGDPPLTVTFDARESTDSDPGDELSYAWDLDGYGEPDDDVTDPVVTHTYDTAGTRTVRLEVTDKAGATDVATTTIRVGTAPAVPTIDQPAGGSLVAVGETVDFSGGATVPGVGALPASALSWRADLLHCPVVDQCHRHPGIYSLDGAASGSFAMPDHDYPSAVELHLSATWQGETATTTRRVDYRTVDVALVANVPGVTFTLGPESGPSPFVRPVPVGSTVTVSAPQAVTNSEGTFRFVSWSGGDAERTHDGVVPDFPVLVVASYEPVD